jgi:hypothetical protein
LIPVALALVLLGVSVNAQTTPSQTVRLAFDAFARSDWPTFTTSVHPEALAAFRTSELGSIIGFSVTNRQVRRGDIPRGNIAISPADWLSPEAIDRAKDVQISAFDGSPTIGELAALSSGAFFTRWCEAAYRPRANDPRPAMQLASRDIIGEIIEGDTLAHVLYREQVESIYLAGSLHIMSLKRANDRWLLLLNDDVVWRFPIMEQE